MTRYSNEVENFYSNQQRIEEMAQRRWKMSANDAECSLLAMGSIARGRVPDGRAAEWLKKACSESFGWKASKTMAEARRVASIDGPPEARIFAYLTANGQPAPNESMFREIVQMVENTARADHEISLGAKLAESDALNEKARQRDAYQFSKENTERVKEHAEQRTNLRDSLKAQMGVTEAHSFADQKRRVDIARSRLADRMEARESQEGPVSLRDQLGDSIDIHRVNAASRDVGYTDIFDESERMVDEAVPHMDSNFDVSEGL